MKAITNIGIQRLPELSIGLPATAASGSLISTTTQSDIKNVLATDAACSRQHLTTCTGQMNMSVFGTNNKPS